jgi:hypothetical protein
MKRKVQLAVITTLLILTSFSKSFSQIAYQDALVLKQYLHNGHWVTGDEKVTVILRRYLKTDQTIESEFNQKNKFTTDFFADAWTASSDGPLSSLISSVGNLDVTNLADGFAKFLVKRSKEELTVSFFSRFYELIKKDEYKDARTLFPQTYATLSAIGDEIYNYQAYINILRESFEKDLNGLLANLPKVITDGRYAKLFNDHPGLKAICLSSIYIGNGLLNKQNPGQIIADYDITLLDNLTDPNIKGATQTLQLFSESLRSNSIDHYWVSTDSLKLLINDPIALQIYFGLIYQKADGIKYKNNSLREILDKFYDAPDELRKVTFFIQGFAKQANIVKTNIDNLAGKDKDKLNYNDYYNYYNSALDLIEYGSNYYQLPGLGDPYKPGLDFQKAIGIARSGGNVALDINRGNYSSALINFFGIYTFAFPNYDEELQSIIDDGNTSSAVKANATLFKGSYNKIQKFLLNYGSFIAAVVQAKNSDDVSKAIETAALPSGSSRIKRETSFNVALNAYTGLFLGNESIQDVKNVHFINSYGLTAPIGVSISWGLHSFLPPFSGTGHASSSIFISLIDIGAVAAYRFKDDTTAQVPTIKLKNIFSPGVFLSLGIPKTPLSVNLGAQMGPNLRQINNNTSITPSDDSSNKIYWRYSISLVVDLPLLNLYTRSK